MKNPKSLAFLLCSLVAVSVFAATWEGTAVIGAAADFPANGLTAACNSFPKDSTIELRNLENGKLIRVTISGGLDNPGVFIVLSPAAAAELGMKPGISSRIRATVIPFSSLPSPDAATASRSNDPDFNPSLLAAAGTAAPGPAASAEPPSPSMTPPAAASEGSAGANPDTSESATEAAPDSSTPGFEPEAPTVIADQAPKAPAEPVAVTPGLAEAQPKGLAPAQESQSKAESPTATTETPPPAATAAPATAAPATAAPATAAPATAETANSPDAGGTSPTLIGGDSPKAASPAAGVQDLAEASPPNLAPSEGAQLSPDIQVPPPPETSVGSAATPALADAAPATGPTEAAAPAESPAQPGTPPSSGGEALASTAGSDETAAPAESPAPAPAESPAGGETAPSATASQPGSEQVLSLEPAAPQPPLAQESSPSPELSPPQSAPATADTATAPTQTPSPALAARPPATREPVLIDRLAKGSYYVQVGVYSSDSSLLEAAGSFDSSWPLASERLAGAKGELYRLFVGPVARDESGMFIVQLRALGYRDAFLRQGD